ncbi:MAG: N-glycosylase/DNA lyase [Candidatus Gracilibacteria bacterium]|nr:N-glycosylase/DNA lyase [Candidatus Gracilibacteria bacterium]
MTSLYNKLNKYKLSDVIDFEKKDLQFVALNNLFKNLNDKDIFFGLILLNSIVCYQLSSTGEKYWAEFSLYFSHIRNLDKTNLVNGFKDFLKTSKGNSRLYDIKIKRIDKINLFLSEFIINLDYYLVNLYELRDKIAFFMNQKNTDKTIVFSIKMIMYGALIVYGEIQDISHKKINIPIDSRLTKIFEKYKGDYNDINLFYCDLSKKLNIAELHLDALIWVNYDSLI